VQKIKAINRIGKRRWDFVLDSGIVVKMPESNISRAWIKLDELLEVRGVEIGIRSIDLRNSDKIILENE
jgi:cell division septal protein FtsQ